MKTVFITLTTLLVLVSGCKSLSQDPISTRFEKRGESLVWIVHNNSDKDIVVKSVSSGVDIYSKFIDEIDGETVETFGVTPSRGVEAYQKPLIIAPGKSHEFSVHGYRALETYETVSANISLDSPGNAISGSLKLSGKK